MPRKFHVFATSDIGEALDVLRERGYELEVYAKPEAPPQALIIEKVKSGIDGLITTLRDQIDAEVFEAGKGHLKVVAQMAVGFDNINRADANRYKIPFTHTADVLTEATAEFAFFMMGALARRMWTAEHLTRENKWSYWHPYLPFLGDEVTGKTVAIIGTGRIGLAMIKKCNGFDMNILCYDPAYQNHEYVDAIQEVKDLRLARGITKGKTWIKYVSFEEALRDADFISVHVPLLREGESNTPTYHLFNERTLRMMKPTAFLVNTSRGPVVDEIALARALREKWIAGAALDVYEKEPLPADSPLRDPVIEDRCRLYPHFASAARITRLSKDGTLCSGLDRCAGRKLRRRHHQDALRSQQRSLREIARVGRTLLSAAFDFVHVLLAVRRIARRLVYSPNSGFSPCAIPNGSRHCRAEACPACTHANRVTSDPATDAIAAHRRNSCERCLSPNKLAARSRKGTGPDRTPPVRTINPLSPCFSGSRWEWSLLSLRNPSRHSKSAAPMPSACRARLRSFPMSSSRPTAAPTPEAAKWIGSSPTF